MNPKAKAEITVEQAQKIMECLITDTIDLNALANCDSAYDYNIHSSNSAYISETTFEYLKDMFYEN